MTTEPPKHLLLTVTDAGRIATALRETTDPELRRIVDRLTNDTGGDFTEIATKLKKMSFCVTCVIEGQEMYCKVIRVQKLGRRLLRLVGRANGTWPPSKEEEA